METLIPTKLPDIFRTPNGINTDIGLFDHLRSEGQVPVEGSPSAKRADVTSGMCPRIILRDSLGRELDTFTTLQEAIYRAKWNVRQSGLSREQLEWRLPKAPAPARPDLSRICPPSKHPAVPAVDYGRESHGYSRALEFDVDDVGFVKESLQYLPYAPSLSFLRQELLVGPKTYFQIVGTVLLHKRILSQTEKRQAVHNFPGFCSGCIRMGLCYGCEKGTDLHFHEDRPMKTGGGFTYFKKDRPSNEISSRHPTNWKIQHPDLTLKKLMEEYSGVTLEGAIPEEIRQHLDTNHHRNKTCRPVQQRKQPVSNIPNFATETPVIANQIDKNFLPDIQIERGNTNDDLETEVQGQSEDGTNDLDLSDRHDLDGRRDLEDDHDLDLRDVEIDLKGAYGGEADVDDDNESESKQGRKIEQRNMKKKAVPRSGATSLILSLSESASKPQIDHGAQRRSHSDERYEHRLPKHRLQKIKDGGDVVAEESDGEWVKERQEIVTDDDSGDNDKNGRSRTRLRLYKAPPPFKLKKSPRRNIEAKSPFSNNRSYNLPTGKTFTVKKSDKPVTEFRDFNNGDVGWKEPRKFELKKSSAKSTKFWSGPPKRKSRKSKSESPSNRRRRCRTPSPRSSSPDSGLDSELLTDTTIKSELEAVREETSTPKPDSAMDRGSTPQHRTSSPDKCHVESPPPPKKREIVKKEKKEKKAKSTEPEREPLPPPPPPREKSSSSFQSGKETPVSREISFVYDRKLSTPELPAIEIPALPELQEKEKVEVKSPKKIMKVIEATPELPEIKKKLPPPPKIRPRIRPPLTRKTKVAEAPVTTEELQQLSDPLDFLAKYCIINPDRLPFYERVFNGAVDSQSPRYVRENPQEGSGGLVQFPPTQLSEKEMDKLKDMTVITLAQTPRRECLSVPEQYLEKLNYSLDFIRTKQDSINTQMAIKQAEKIHLMAELAKGIDRDIARVDYKTKTKKKKKKKKKKRKGEEDELMSESLSMYKNFQPTRACDITDEVIVSRMDEKMMKKVKKDPIVKKLTMEISRDVEKFKNYERRVMELEDEKDVIGLYCMDNYFREQIDSVPPYAFRRQQSRLYQKLHPDPDVQMNIEEVSSSLQAINNKLLTEKEFQYIYFVLDLPKREKINFRLFSIVAALSEKVTQMDPVIRKLINKVDYNALDVKMDKSKELFSLLQDESRMPSGSAPADILAVELTAGGLTPEHTNYVLSKFNREGKGFMDFLDFVTYVPLFIEIHKRIIQDPFNDTQDI